MLTISLNENLNGTVANQMWPIFPGQKVVLFASGFLTFPQSWCLTLLQCFWNGTAHGLVHWYLNIRIISKESRQYSGALRAEGNDCARGSNSHCQPRHWVVSAKGSATTLVLEVYGSSVHNISFSHISKNWTRNCFYTARNLRITLLLDIKKLKLYCFSHYEITHAWLVPIKMLVS